MFPFLLMKLEALPWLILFLPLLAASRAIDCSFASAAPDSSCAPVMSACWASAHALHSEARRSKRFMTVKPL